MRFVNFECTNCGHTLQTCLGNYPLKTITDNPCNKCDKKTMVYVQDVKVVIETSSSVAPTIVHGTGSSFKGLPADYKNFVSNIKKNTKRNTIKDIY